MSLLSFLFFDLVLPMLIFAAFIGAAVYFVQTQVHVPVYETRQQTPQPEIPAKYQRGPKTHTPPPSPIPGTAGTGMVISASTGMVRIRHQNVFIQDPSPKQSNVL